MNRKEEKKNPDDQTAHIDLLVPEAKIRSKVTDHAGGVWGAGGGGVSEGREGTETSTGVTEPTESPRRSGRGPADQATELPSAAVPGPAGP